MNTFPCHKTIDYDRRHDLQEQGASEEELVKAAVQQTQQCAGALIMFENAGKPFQMAQIAERLGLYDPSRLDRDAPVYDSPDHFIDAQSDR